MEALLCRQLLEQVHFGSNGRIRAEEIVTDDDSTLRDHCSAAEKWREAQARGELAEVSG